MHNDKNIHFCNFLGNGKIDFLKSILFDNMNSTEKKKKKGKAEMAISEKNRQIKGFHALIIFARKVGIHIFPPFLFLSSCLLSPFQIFFSYSLNVEKSTFRGNDLKKSIKLVNSTSTPSCL